MVRLRCTGMSIKQMREYAALVIQGHATLRRRQELLDAHRERVRRTIAEWTESLELLDSKIDFDDQWQRTGKRPSRDFATTPAAKRRQS
ncbi:MerR family DNA-binding protein [Myxococcaceae bacterium JPH2]|nr:MerR family DNA-binding protein [Myxococcaceae bacterium JPH2]